MLNLSYDPLNVTIVKKALVLYLKNKVTIEEYGEGVIRTPSKEYPVPSVIRLKRYVNIISRRGHAFRSLLKHYMKTKCMYCGKEISIQEMTWDHIVPRSRGGSSRWDNLAIACSYCNALKGNKLPEELGLQLQLDPRRIPKKHLLFYLRWLGLLDEKWRPYIYYELYQSKTLVIQDESDRVFS